MKTCTYCGAPALYRDRLNDATLCLAHARLEVTGPRQMAPRQPLTIRLATPADRLPIVQMAEYFWGEVEVECFGHRYRVDALPACVACDAGEIVGLASFAREGDAVNIVMLNVSLHWQGQGVARSLIEAVADLARDEGAGRVIVATSNDDLPALALYQRLGFVITKVLVGKLVEHHGGIEPGFAGIPVRDEIHLELRL